MGTLCKRGGGNDRVYNNCLAQLKPDPCHRWANQTPLGGLGRMPKERTGLEKGKASFTWLLEYVLV